MKLKRNGTTREKTLYMKVVETSTTELVQNLNKTLQQMGSDQQLKITTFAKPVASTPEEQTNASATEQTADGAAAPVSPGRDAARQAANENRDERGADDVAVA